MSCLKNCLRVAFSAATIAVLNLALFTTAATADIQLIDNSGAITGTAGGSITLRTIDFADALWNQGTSTLETPGSPSYAPPSTTFPGGYHPIFQGTAMTSDGVLPVRANYPSWWERPYDVLGEADRGSSTSSNLDPRALSLGRNWYHHNATDPLSGSVTVHFDGASQPRADGTSTPDLLLFEVGSDPEAFTVEVSQDGFNWYEVGNYTSTLPTVGTHAADTFLSVGGLNDSLDVSFADGSFSASDNRVYGIDLDAQSSLIAAFGASLPSNLFPYVRIFDSADTRTDWGGITGSNSYGADLDAIAVLNLSALAEVPEPATLTLLGGLGLMVGLWWRRRRK